MVPLNNFASMVNCLLVANCKPNKITHQRCVCVCGGGGVFTGIP